VLTSSRETGDAKAAYAAGANSFLIKPLDFHETLCLMTDLSAQWLSPAISAEPLSVSLPV
jgi:CheY-like chemotaxis protein